MWILEGARSRCLLHRSTSFVDVELFLSLCPNWIVSHERPVIAIEKCSPFSCSAADIVFLSLKVYSVRQCQTGIAQAVRERIATGGVLDNHLLMKYPRISTMKARRRLSIATVKMARLAAAFFFESRSIAAWVDTVSEKLERERQIERTVSPFTIPIPTHDDVFFARQATALEEDIRDLRDPSATEMTALMIQACIRHSRPSKKEEFGMEMVKALTH